MDKQKKKLIKRYIAWGCIALVVLILASMPLLAGKKAEKDGPQASILHTTLQQCSIDSQIIGGGLLASKNTEEITIPEAVKLTKYLVENGDTVKKGDALARVDKVSVMLALTEVQETLDYLAEQIAAASNKKDSNKITAQADGIVKVVYGKPGDTVRDVMLEHGALAVISLDNKMAVKITRDTGLTYGKAVTVTLANGKNVEGFVESNIDDVLTVTIKDKSYPIGETVTVSAEDGTELGSGELFVHNPWNAAAYYGTIQKVHIKAGNKVTSGKQLFQLEVGDYSTNFQILANQRQEYEELMQELFEMYNTGVLSAPCDGFVTGVDEDGTFLLAANSGEQEWFFQPLSGNADANWAVMLLSGTGAEGEGGTEGGSSDETEPTEPDPNVCTKLSDCTAPVHDLGCPNAVYYVTVGQVLSNGSVATNPGGAVPVTGANLATVSKNVALGGSVATWPTAGLLNLDLTTYYNGVAPAGSILFQLVDVLSNTHYVYAGAAASGGQMPGMGGLAGFGGIAGFGGFGGRGGTAAIFEPYSLETVTVASVTSQDEMTLEISIDEQDIAKLHTGQEATITVEALTGQSFPAVITTISNTGTNEGGSSKFAVKLTLSMSGDMLPGMNASAYLPLQSHSVMAIPVAALVEDGAKTIVYTGYDAKKETLLNPVVVTTGVSDGEYVQILSGLSEGDTVYYAYYDTIEQSFAPDLGLRF